MMEQKFVRASSEEGRAIIATAVAVGNLITEINPPEGIVLTALAIYLGELLANNIPPEGREEFFQAVCGQIRFQMEKAAHRDAGGGRA